MSKLAGLTVLLWINFAASSTVWAWGRDGHEIVGHAAANLIAGSNAERKVAALLDGSETLAGAAGWAACAKGRRYCQASLIPEMQDFAAHNPAHHSYHYTNIPFQRTACAQTAPGVSEHDVVHILQDALRVLTGVPAKNPTHKLTEREALFILAHMIGDIHQPLHVGAAYLNKADDFVIPTSGAEARKTSIKGGNFMCSGSKNLHGFWDSDSIIKAMKMEGIESNEDLAIALIQDVSKIKPSVGAIEPWPKKWANESLRISKQQLSTSPPHTETRQELILLSC